MSVNNGKISAPVSISDLQTMFAVHLTRTVSGQQQNALCADLGSIIAGEIGDTVPAIDGNGDWTIDGRVDIKMWAKYKPVVWPNIDTLAALNSGSLTWNPSCAANLQWWKSTNGNYGLDFSGAMVNVGSGTNGVITALTSILNKIDGAANEWKYTKPLGGVSQPFRMTDLLQYNHNIQNPISSVSTSNVQASINSNYEVVIEFIRAAMTSIEQRDYLIPEDVTEYTLNLGIAIYKASGNTYTPIAWVFGSQTWLGMGITYSDQADGIITQTESMVVSRLKDGGTYYILPLFATAALAQPPSTPGTDNVYNNSAGAPNSQMKFITVPYVGMISFTATRRTTTQTIGVPELSNKDISALWTYNTTLYLNSTYSGYTGGTTFSLVLAVVNELYNGTPAQGNYAYYNDFGAVTVPANTRQSIGATGLLSLDSSHSWRVIVSVNGEESTFALRTPSQT